MNPAIFVQTVHTTWSKSSRGGIGAQKRSAIPLAFPCGWVENGHFATEHFRFHEKDGFQPATPARQATKLENPFQYRWKSFVLLWDGEKAIARFRWDIWGAGAPRMVTYDEAGNIQPYQRDLIIPLNGWARVRWMGRFSDTDGFGWWYEHSVVNVAWFNLQPPSDLFSRTQPNLAFERLPRLR